MWTWPVDRRPIESFEFKWHLIEKASQIYVLVIFSSFNLNVTLFDWHKVNNVAQILISNVKLAEGPKRSSLFKSFSDNEEILIEKHRDLGKCFGLWATLTICLAPWHKSPTDSQRFHMFLACYTIGDFYTRQYGLVQSKTRGALLILLEGLMSY